MLIAEVTMEAGNVPSWVVPTVIVPMAALLGFLVRWLVSTTTEKDKQLKTVMDDQNRRYDIAAAEADKRYDAMTERWATRMDEAINKFTESLTASRKETRLTVEAVTSHCQDEIKAIWATLQSERSRHVDAAPNTHS